MELAVFDPHILLKHKAAAQGETRIRADGKTYKKTGKKWVVVSKVAASRSAKRVESDVLNRGNLYFNYAMASNLGDTVDKVLSDMGIDSFDALVKEIKTGPADAAHKVYKEIVDRVAAGPGTSVDKQAVVHLIGQSLVTLRSQFSTEPKVALKMKVTSKKGTEYYKYKEELPTLKATAISKAKKKMGGWSVTGKLESSHMRKMLKTKAAKLISGKIDAKRKWHMPRKAADIDLKYKGDSLLIRVKQIRKGEERTRATAKAEIRIPYAFAKAFLQSHIASAKTRNNFIFRMERSAGYRDFLQRAAA